MLGGIGVPAVDAAQRVISEVPDRRTVGGEGITHPRLIATTGGRLASGRPVAGMTTTPRSEASDRTFRV